MAMEPPDLAKQIVAEYWNRTKEPHEATLWVTDTHLVWFSKTLRNWKALVITTQRDQVYYELTHDGLQDVTYLDVYTKTANMEIPHPPPSPGLPTEAVWGGHERP